MTTWLLVHVVFLATRELEELEEKGARTNTGGVARKL